MHICISIWWFILCLVHLWQRLQDRYCVSFVPFLSVREVLAFYMKVNWVSLSLFVVDCKGK